MCPNYKKVYEWGGRNLRIRKLWRSSYPFPITNTILKFYHRVVKMCCSRHTHKPKLCHGVREKHKGWSAWITDKPSLFHFRNFLPKLDHIWYTHLVYLQCQIYGWNNFRSLAPPSKNITRSQPQRRSEANTYDQHCHNHSTGLHQPMSQDISQIYPNDKIFHTFLT